MADILVQNVIKKVTSAIQANADGLDYNTLFGQSLKSEIEDIIRAAPTTGPYSDFAGGGAASLSLCDLSATVKLSNCACNYSGSGTSNTDSCNPQNIWHTTDVLLGSASVSEQEISDFIVAASAELTDLAAVSTATANQIDDDVWLAWLAIKSVFQTEGNNDVLLHWYGVGANSPAGAALSEDKIKVCAAGDTWKCGVGATCTWTVPAGATRAKFQAWGAGRGSNPACCCGGQSFSGNGAYAEIVIDVTPGDQYVICAGCSCQRWCCSSTPPGEGCMSGVTGPGICCFKADGNYCYTDNCDSMNGMRCNIGAGSACRRWQNPYCTDSGPCWCSYGEYCYDNSCATCGVVPVYPNCCYSNYCICACDDRNPVHGAQYGHRGIIGGGCVETNNYGYHIRPPIIDADTGLKFTGGCWCQTFTSSCCCGGCNGSNWTHHPGMGGVGTHTMGGNNNHKGDVGRGGMVQVSWS